MVAVVALQDGAAAVDSRGEADGVEAEVVSVVVEVEVASDAVGAVASDVVRQGVHHAAAVDLAADLAAAGAEGEASGGHSLCVYAYRCVFLLYLFILRPRLPCFV